jgi:hypothetical protein
MSYVSPVGSLAAEAVSEAIELNWLVQRQSINQSSRQRQTQLSEALDQSINGRYGG